MRWWWWRHGSNWLCKHLWIARRRDEKEPDYVLRLLSPIVRTRRILTRFPVGCLLFFFGSSCTVLLLVPDETIVKNQCGRAITRPEMCSNVPFLPLPRSLWHLVWLSNICSCDTHTHSYHQLEFGHATNPIGILNESSLLADEDPTDFLLFLFIETTGTDTRERENRSPTH